MYVHSHFKFAASYLTGQYALSLSLSKGVAIRRALDLGIAHAQFPISQYIKLNYREVTVAVKHD